eukprot:127316-Karenia_brevis.AAC.1
MLFGCETIALTQSVCDRLDGAFAKFVVTMMDVNKQEDESLQEFVMRRRKLAKDVLQNAGLFLSTIARRRQWRYI